MMMMMVMVMVMMVIMTKTALTMKTLAMVMMIMIMRMVVMTGGSLNKSKPALPSIGATSAGRGFFFLPRCHDSSCTVTGTVDTD